ncbi:hypothetical protein BDV93DRAFT_459064 [Ceratobasidium sp. AG-I]|nr:hypothetical protein BDV93DRAFT_459064 [Ceratobasidium sp. AG-I]
MQNFARQKGFLDFCHASLILSPQTYRLLRKHFPLPAERNLRMHRSRAPGFSSGISDLTIMRATDYLATIEYTGPVSIGCDDTQLLSRMAPYFDNEKKQWMLLGGVGDPVAIATKVSLHEILIEEANSRIFQCRLWVLQVPIPGVPVFILAAMPISSSMKANELLLSHNKLIGDLLATGITISTYSCDGSATERKVANLFLQSASSSETRVISHPKAGFSPIVVTLHQFGPRLTPIVAIQDVKHAIKAARNNAYSGAHSMIIGNKPVYFLQIVMLAKDPGSPLYMRDVHRVDRQDDLAALRLFSSAFLRHVLHHDLTGLAVWLFVFGDFFDAFQSRSLVMIERVSMVLRLKFFLDIWKASLSTLGYSEAHHFLSRDTYYIFENLIHGFLGLVFVYRDCLDYPNYPFCPRMHSTESCEHTFGEARKAKTDFSFSEFISMIPKLRVMADVAVQTGNYDGDAKARASGYYHTQYSTQGININALSSFPPDSTIHQAAKTACEEAEALFAICGIPPTAELYPAPLDTGASFTAPSISTWFQEELLELEDNPGSECNLACEIYEEPISAAAELEMLLHDETIRVGATAQLDDQLDAYAAASVALQVEEQGVL